MLFTQSKPGLADSPAAATGWRVISVPDLRWGRRDIKTVQLLYPSMAKMAAKAAGADDAWLIEEGGVVTEGSSNNTWIIAGGRIVTRALSHDILNGITRTAVRRLAAEAGIAVEERSFTIAEAQAADEAFATSATAFVMPVVEIDGVRVADGRPGPDAPVARALYRGNAPRRNLTGRPRGRIRRRSSRDTSARIRRRPPAGRSRGETP